MSHPNSFFLATREAAIAHASGQATDIDGRFAFAGITDLDLSNLFSIVADEEFDFDLHELLPLDDAIPELIGIPARFLDALAGRDPSDIPLLAQRWSETEELDCDPQGLVPVLEALLSLAKSRGSRDVHFTQ